jgi:uncharacterized glyoxalase superfamily protein PhnB
MRDPFDDLREPVHPVAPRPAFAADLRARLARALDPALDPDLDTALDPSTSADPEVPAMTVIDVPTTTTALTPYLAVADARAAIRFYEAVFGAVVDGGLIVADDGRIGHAQLRIGAAAIMLADPWDMPGVGHPGQLGGTSVQLNLQVADVDATVERAAAHGGTVVRPAADQSYGERMGVIDDPFGHRWMLAAPLVAMTAEEKTANLRDEGFSVEAAETIDLGTRAPAPASPPPAASGSEPARLWYVTLFSPDLDRSAEFLRELFGWETERGGAGGYHVGNTTPPLGLAPADEPRADLFFKVADFRGTLEKVRELGGSVEEPVQYASGWSAACRDPQGLAFYVSEPAPGYK